MRPLIVAFVLLVAASRLMAHHGWNDVDKSNVITLTGEIKNLEYTNPHAFFELDASGKVWRVELVSPATLERRGMTRDMLAPGTPISLTGFSYKRVSGHLRAEKITVGSKTVSMLPFPVKQ